MAVERTLSIIKPEAVARNIIGEIYRRFEQAGLRIIAARMLHLSDDQARRFYAVHKERPFYDDLVRYMQSGPVMVQVLEGDAAPGTIRADFAESIEANAVHGSDSVETACNEIDFFFSEDQICPRTR